MPRSRQTSGPTALPRNRPGCEASPEPVVLTLRWRVGSQMLTREAVARTRGAPAGWLLGRAILVTSGCGFPLTQAVIARFGRAGAIVAEGVAVGLLVRDCALVRRGAPRRLRPFPAALLRLELGAAALASVAGLAAISRPHQGLDRTPAGVLEALRRGAVGLLFGLHTYRFWIYLQPDHGLRTTPADDGLALEPR
jgi:hypothetical protein